MIAVGKLLEKHPMDNGIGMVPFALGWAVFALLAIVGMISWAPVAHTLVTPYNPPMCRRFERMKDGKTEYFELSIERARVYERWGTIGTRKGGATSVMRDSEADAAKHADKKAASKLRGGFAEVDPDPDWPAQPDVDADVIDALNGHTNAIGGHSYAYELVSGHAGIYRHDSQLLGGEVARVLVTSHDRKRAIQVTTRNPDAGLIEIAQQLAANRERIFAADVIKAPLVAPLAGFSHWAAFSPYTWNCRELARTFRSIWWAFPIHDCELSGGETPTVAEVRIATVSKRGGLITWPRDPVPVTDLRLVAVGRRRPKNQGSARQPKFLVCGPEQIERAITEIEKGQSGSWLELRNYRGAVARVDQRDGTLFIDGAEGSAGEAAAVLHQHCRA